MSKLGQEKIPRVSDSEGWALAIEQAERGINQAKERIEKLERSIEVFKECRDAEEPWPGTSETTEKVTDRAL
jgi:hypothetical protein